MLHITIPAVELFDDVKREFTNSKPQDLQLEHSLVSLSKWESKWHKPFLTRGNKSKVEEIDYIRAMTINQNVDPNIYGLITEELFEKIRDYISDPMTATILPQQGNNKGKSEVVTSEIIYYWMVTFNIPFECQKWHLNRLLTLINVCNLKNQPAKKGNAKDLAAQRRALNETRKAKLHTNG